MLRPIDFRKAIRGLSVMVEQAFGYNPFAAALYVFINRARTKIKILYWHRNGFCLWMKDLEAEKFSWLPSDEMAQNGATQTISEQEFAWLLEGYPVWQNNPHKVLNFTSVS